MNFTRILPSSLRFWTSAGILVFAVQALLYAFGLKTHHDEAIYSFLGLNVVTGTYAMYQQGGPLFTHLPLSYLLPGAAHFVFGSDLVVARFLSLIFTALTLLCTYLLCRRVGGRSAPVISLWLLVASIQSVRILSLGGPLAFCDFLLALSLLLLCCPIASPRREVLAACVISVALMTRQNMVISWAIILAYGVFTQKRWYHGVWVAVAGTVFPIVVTALYWPGIVTSALLHPLFQDLLRSVGWNPGAELLVEPVLRSPVSLTAYLGTFYYLGGYYFLILLSLAVSGIALLLSWSDVRPFRGIDQGARIVWLMVALFAVNLAAHVLGPMVAGAPFATYNYINYCVPLGAALGGLGLEHLLQSSHDRFVKGSIVGGLAIAILVSVSTWMIPSQFIMCFPCMDGIRHAAQKLAQVSTPESKIFSLCYMHVFLLADRRPFPAMVWPEWGLSVSADAAQVKKLGRYNYDMAAEWLDRADLIVLAEPVVQNMGGVFRDQPKGGADLVKLVEEKISQGFEFVEAVSAGNLGKILFYRRVSGVTPQHESSKPNLKSVKEVTLGKLPRDGRVQHPEERLDFKSHPLVFLALDKVTSHNHIDRSEHHVT
jgi:hypothetical protein